jgi:hypothetical protein
VSTNSDLNPRQRRFVEGYLLEGCDPSRILAENRRSAGIAAAKRC